MGYTTRLPQLFRLRQPILSTRHTPTAVVVIIAGIECIFAILYFRSDLIGYRIDIGNVGGSTGYDKYRLAYRISGILALPRVRIDRSCDIHH